MATYTYNELATGEKDSARDVERMCKVARVTYTFDGTEVADETIRLFTPIADGVVTGYAISSVGLTTCTVDIGKENGTATGIANDVDAVTGASSVLATGVGITKGQKVYATMDTLAGNGAGDTLTIAVFYDFAT